MKCEGCGMDKVDGKCPVCDATPAVDAPAAEMPAEGAMHEAEAAPAMDAAAEMPAVEEHPAA